MILADKIILQRKKNGWSQEELADRVGVSRQSVSKWEGAQSVPDLNKMLNLAEVFGVSTDYLLKDDIEDTDLPVETTEDTDGFPARRVSLEEANEFLELNENGAGKVGIATMMCIICSVPTILFSGIYEAGVTGMSEALATVLGLIPLFGLIAAAVAMFIFHYSKMKKFEFLEKEIIDTAYGVDGMVKERREAYRHNFVIGLIIGIILILISPGIVILGTLGGENNELLQIITVCVMLIVIGIAVAVLVKVSIIWEGYKKLLQEENFSAANKRDSHKLEGVISGIYWLLVVTTYLLWSFFADSWDKTWIIWPVAGLLYAVIMIIIGAVRKDRR